MGAERQLRPDDRELRRLLDELDRTEPESVMPGKYTLAERLEQLAPMHHHTARAASNARAGMEPRAGRFALVGEMLSAKPKLKFDDCRALALRDVLSRLGKHPRLRAETLAAADPHVAQRLARGSISEQPTPHGQAMWGAANRRAVTLYRRATATGMGAPETRPVAEAIGAIGKGIPLPLDVRLKLEAALGVSLESVRLHIGQVARDAADAVCAEAFTVGEDIFFPTYDPTSSRCQETLAHEVVHTIQWRQGRIGVAAGGPAVSRPDDPLELEAERAATSIAARACHAPAEPVHTATIVPRAFHRPVETTLTATTGRANTHSTHPPTVGSQPAVTMALGLVAPTAAPATGIAGHTVMRRQAIENQRPNDVPLEVSSWGPLQRLGDLKKSIIEAPSHIMEVGGEYASLLAENWHWIGLGILAGFGIERATESAHPWVAISGFVVAQLAQGTGLAVIATSIKSHAENWAKLGWNACGDVGMIREASKELVRLVGSVLSLASFAFRVVARIVLRWIRSYFDKALKGGEILPTVATANGYAYAGGAAVESTTRQPPVRTHKAPARRSPMSNVPLSMAVLSDPEPELPPFVGGSPGEEDLAHWEREAGVQINIPKDGLLTLHPNKTTGRFTPESRIGSVYYRITTNGSTKQITILSLHIDDRFLDPKGDTKYQRNQLRDLMLSRLLRLHPHAVLSGRSNGSVNAHSAHGTDNGRQDDEAAGENGSHLNEATAQPHQPSGYGDVAKSAYTSNPTEQRIRRVLERADKAAQINTLPRVAAEEGYSVEQLHQLAAERGITLGGIRWGYEQRTKLERADRLERWNSPVFHGGPVEAASHHGAPGSQGNGASRDEVAHTSSGDNGHSRSGRKAGKPPMPPRVRPEESFGADDRRRIAHRAMNAPEFGKLTQIAREEETSPLAVYHFCEELDFTTVRQPPAPAMKRDIVARLKAGEPPEAIAIEKQLPLEILKLWSRGRYSEEEQLAFLGETIRFSTHVVNARHGVSPRSLYDWKVELGWQHPVRTWGDAFEWPQYAPRAKESFGLEQRREMALEANHAPEFGGLTKVALRHGTTPAVVYQCEREFGFETARKPVHPQTKQNAIDKVSGGSDPAAVAAELNLPIEIIREWTHGQYTKYAAEEKLGIALESVHSVDDDVGVKYHIRAGTVEEWRNDFGIPKQGKLQAQSTALSIEAARDIVAEVNAAPKFGEVTRIANKRRIAPEDVYLCAKKLGIQLVRDPVDPTLKQKVVARFRGVDAMKDAKGYAAMVTATATEFDLPIEIVRSWARGDFSDEEALAFLAEAASLGVNYVLKKHQLKERTFQHWKENRFQSYNNDGQE